MSSNEPEEERKGSSNLFERNPKKTLFFSVIIATLLVVFGAEAILAWTDTSSERAGIVRYVRMRENPPLTEYKIVPNEHYIKATGNYAPERHRLRIDREGFIHPSSIHESPNLNIVFLGGSTTECLYVEEDKRFPYLVGRILEKETRKVNAYNGGVGGNDSLHSINALINKALRLEPDIVVVMHNINDLSVLMGQGTYWHDIPTRGVIIEETPIFAAAALARQLKNLLVPKLYIRLRNGIQALREKVGVQQEEYVRPPGVRKIDESALVDRFGRNLVMLIEISRAQGATPVLMTMASRLSERPDDVLMGGYGNLPPMSADEYVQIRRMFNLFNEKIRRIGAEKQVPVIDLAAKIPMEQRYIYDVIHLTDTGSQLAATIIAETLESQVLVKAVTKQAAAGSQQ